MRLKKLLALVLCVSLVGGIFVGCSGSETKENKEVSENTDNNSEETKGTKIITDHTGEQIEIPEKINRIVISSLWPLPSVYCLFRGSTEGLVGMHPASMSAAENSYLAKVFPEITEIDTSFVEGNEVNIEQLMNLKPDVIFYSATNKAEKEMFESAGIPAVGFSTTIADYNSIETYANWIDLLGQIFGESERSGEIIEYGRKVEADILNITSEIPKEEKPKVLVLYNYGDGKILTSGQGFFGHYWIETAGGINVAENLKGQAEINMEQIYEWNPDMIFITNFSSVMPEDLYSNSIEGNDWSKVKAVVDKKVYKFPLGMYRWFPTSSDTPLCLMWLAKHIQPEKFENIDMDKEIKDYYIKYYNVELTDEDLNVIYNPAREAAEK